MYWVLRYHLVDDYLQRRPPFRAEHLALARAAVERRELRLAGALADPADEALLIFEAPDPAPAEAFAQADPYVRHGLVQHWQVRPWSVVLGADYPGDPPTT